MGHTRFCYLMILGVDAPSRGQGIGKVLVRPGLSFADTHGMPCYLESSNPRNVSFYDSIGFKTARIIHLEENNDKSPLLTCMIRPAQMKSPASQ